ncbi:MAG TPA: tyrosine-type recombinase/integrase, partial [bacterium]|nr:tyrosine-type recombinase/integrase [bacterium]
VTTSFEARTQVLGAPKTDRSVRDVDMVPTVRRVLETLPSRIAGGLVFPRTDGRIFSRDTMYEAWQRTHRVTGVRPIRPYDLRHMFASLLIAAGKNPLHIARQMGHYSAGFTLDTYGHLMESIPKRQVEWIDELVFPEGFEAALNLHLSGALRGAMGDNAVQPVGSGKRLIDKGESHVVQ